MVTCCYLVDNSYDDRSNEHSKTTISVYSIISPFSFSFSFLYAFVPVIDIRVHIWYSGRLAIEEAQCEHRGEFSCLLYLSLICRKARICCCAVDLRGRNPFCDGSSTLSRTSRSRKRRILLKSLALRLMRAIPL